MCVCVCVCVCTCPHLCQHLDHQVMSRACKRGVKLQNPSILVLRWHRDVRYLCSMHTATAAACQHRTLPVLGSGVTLPALIFCSAQSAHSTQDHARSSDTSMLGELPRRTWLPVHSNGLRATADLEYMVQGVEVSLLPSVDLHMHCDMTHAHAADVHAGTVLSGTDMPHTTQCQKHGADWMHQKLRRMRRVRAYLLPSLAWRPFMIQSTPCTA